MIIVTTDAIPGKEIVQSVGWVKGSTIRARHIGTDIVASLRGVVGGEVIEYTKMMAESREEAISRMVEDAEAQGANAIVGLKFSTSMVMQNASEILAYGTGVVVK
ncbi:MAG: YbjQ family protein [Dehalococcoidia bacterium]|nr:YbjQ family protein [Dehalococcoidia bacterium]